MGCWVRCFCLTQREYNESRYVVTWPEQQIQQAFFLLKSSESLVKSHHTFKFVGLHDSYYYARGWMWQQANTQIGWTCADLIKLMMPEETERGIVISGTLICHFRAWMTQGLLTAHIKALVNLRWAPSFMKVSGTASFINASSGLR